MESKSKKEEIITLIKFIDKEFKKDFESRLSTYGLTAQQGRLLFFINWNEINNSPIRQVDIEKKFQLTKSTVSGLVERMLKANLINKRKEGHISYLVPSEYGQSIVNDIFNKRTECLEKMLYGLDEKEIDELHTLLTKVLNNKGGND